MRGGQGYVITRDILDSGHALAKIQAIIKAQSDTPDTHVPVNLQQPVLANTSGIITDIDNLQMAHIARLAGAPIDPGASVDLNRKLGEQVKQGEPLYTIHAEFAADFHFSCESAAKESGYQVEAAELTRE